MIKSLTELEKAVLTSFIQDHGFEKDFFGNDFNLLQVKERDLDGVGFHTTFSPNHLLKSVSLKESPWGRSPWGRIGAILNKNTDTGYLIYIDGDSIDTLEGYTYEEKWPETISSFEIYPLKEPR